MKHHGARSAAHTRCHNKAGLDFMKHALIILLALVSAVGIRAAPPVQTTLIGSKAEHVWPLKELDAGLPADRTPYECLLLEFKASSSQRFDLGLQTPDGRLAKRIGPFAGVWVRASIPLRAGCRHANAPALSRSDATLLAAG